MIAVVLGDDGGLRGCPAGISARAANHCLADHDVPTISLVTPLFNIERAIGLFDTWPADLPYITSRCRSRLHPVGVLPGDPRSGKRRAKMDGITPGHLAYRPARRLATLQSCVHFRLNDLLLMLSLTATKAANTSPPVGHRRQLHRQFVPEEPTGSIAAGAIVITIPTIVFVLIFQRRIVAGLTLAP